MFYTDLYITLLLPDAEHGRIGPEAEQSGDRAGIIAVWI